MYVHSQFQFRLAALVAKTKAVHLQSHLDFDWHQPTRLPFWLPKRLAASIVSHFYHGEMATAQMCNKIHDRITNKIAQTFLALQRRDELRHARIYKTYLNKIGDLEPQPSPFQDLYHRMLSWQGAPEAIILVFHVVLEGESLQLQHQVDQWLPCPLFKKIDSVIARDEARHIAFGNIYLRETLPHLPLPERQKIFRWIQSLWLEGVSTAMKGFSPPGFFSGTNTIDNWIEAEWAERLDDLQATGLFNAKERSEFLAI